MLGVRLLGVRLLGASVGIQGLRVSAEIPEKSRWKCSAWGLSMGRKLGRAGGHPRGCSHLRVFPRDRRVPSAHPHPQWGDPRVASQSIHGAPSPSPFPSPFPSHVTAIILALPSSYPCHASSIATLPVLPSSQSCHPPSPAILLPCHPPGPAIVPAMPPSWPLPSTQQCHPPSPAILLAPAIIPALGFPFTEGGAEKNASIIEPGRRARRVPLADAAQVEPREPQSDTSNTIKLQGSASALQGQLLRG